MKKYVDRIKRQFANELSKGGLVVLGAVGGMFISKGLDKLTEDKPTLNAIVKYGMPVVMAGGGIILTSATEEKSKLKYLGYGLEAAGVIEGIRIIPVVKDYLHGILGSSEIPAASAFLTENEERQRLMQGFGMANLPVGKATLKEQPDYETNLPSLSESQENGSIGYSGSITDDADAVSGIL